MISSVLALRSTCQELRDKTCYQVVECFFSTVALDMGSCSMPRLIDIASNEALASHVKAIGLSPKGFYVKEHQDVCAGHGINGEPPRQMCPCITHPLVEFKWCVYEENTEWESIATVNKIIRAEAFESFPNLKAILVGWNLDLSPFHACPSPATPFTCGKAHQTHLNVLDYNLSSQTLGGPNPTEALFRMVCQALDKANKGTVDLGLGITPELLRELNEASWTPLFTAVQSHIKHM